MRQRAKLTRVDTEDGYDSDARVDGTVQRFVVVEPQIVAQPDEDGSERRHRCGDGLVDGRDNPFGDVDPRDQQGTNGSLLHEFPIGPRRVGAAAAKRLSAR